MRPFEFLLEECRSVRAALNETLRHDYGPESSPDYFNECASRLLDIEVAVEDDPEMDPGAIATKMHALSALGSRISLIERSHLGEFSWPFVESIKAIAGRFLLDTDPDPSAKGPTGPLIHVIAEGMHYQIVDDVQPRIGNRRIIVVAFPRQLKHHVLLHSIFGHELGHTAFASTHTGFKITHRVLTKLTDQTALQDQTQAKIWLERCQGRKGGALTGPALDNWRTEIVCDLFGLLLFGPSFVAAHRAILEPLAGDFTVANDLNETHPPYLVRRQILVASMRILEWDEPVTATDAGAVHEAEKALMDYVMELPAAPWEALLSDDQLRAVLDAFRTIVNVEPDVVYAPAEAEVCKELVTRLTLGRPPIHQTLDPSGVPINHRVPTHHCLYAGWCAWFGRDALHAEFAETTPKLRQFTFLEINRLCDYALLQQCAIDLRLAG